MNSFFNLAYAKVEVYMELYEKKNGLKNMR